MKNQVEPSATPSEKTPVSRLSQAIFVAIGLGIVVGGIWALSQGSGPYHPEIPVTKSHTNLLDGS